MLRCAASLMREGNRFGIRELSSVSQGYEQGLQQKLWRTCRGKLYTVFGHKSVDKYFSIVRNPTPHGVADHVGKNQAFHSRRGHRSPMFAHTLRCGEASGGWCRCWAYRVAVLAGNTGAGRCCASARRASLRSMPLRRSASIQSRIQHVNIWPVETRRTDV